MGVSVNLQSQIDALKLPESSAAQVVLDWLTAFNNVISPVAKSAIQLELESAVEELISEYLHMQKSNTNSSSLASKHLADGRQV